MDYHPATTPLQRHPMTKKQIKVLPGEFSIHRMGSQAEIPAILVGAMHCWIARTQEELSVVCDATIPLDSERADPGWKCLEVAGPIDFSEIGITAEISTLLADAGISVVSLATFDTDYFLIKAGQVQDAARALRGAGWLVGGV